MQAIQVPVDAEDANPDEEEAVGEALLIPADFVMEESCHQLMDSLCTRVIYR